MECNMTPLEKGVFVYIDEIQLELLKEKKGFLSVESYPDEYKKLKVKNEVGRFLFFRFILMK